MNEISSLQLEIDQLQTQLVNIHNLGTSLEKLTLKTDKELKRVLCYLRDLSDNEFIEVIKKESMEMENTDSKFDDYAEQVRTLAYSTGISFSNASHSLVSGTSIREYTIEGTSHEIEFILSFEVDESQMIILQMTINIDPEIRQEIQPFIHIVEKQKSLRNFFTGFERYASLHFTRKKLFLELKVDHEKWVTLPKGGNSTVIYVAPPDQKTGLKFNLLYTVKCTIEGRVEPVLEIYPQASSEIKNADTNGILKSLPAHFKELVKLKGLQTALTIIMLLVKGDTM